MNGWWNAVAHHFQAPIEVHKEMNLSGGCCGDGYVTAEFVINRRCFVPGEKVLLNGSVEYMTNARVRRTTVAIVQVELLLCLLSHSEKSYSSSILLKIVTLLNHIHLFVRSLLLHWFLHVFLFSLFCFRTVYVYFLCIFAHHSMSHSVYR